MTMSWPEPQIELSLAEAREIAIAAALPADGFPHVTAALDHLHVVQLDSISTLARAHQLTLTTRIPGTTTADIDDALYAGPTPVAFDYPAHALALVPLADWPLWAFRRRATRRRPQYPDQQTRAALFDRITHEGPLPLRRLREAGETGTGWDWGSTKTAVEFLLWSGELASTRRTGGQRLFDLAERCIPAAHLNDELTDDECLIRLLGHAGTAMGVATADDLGDYLRIPNATATRLIPDTPLTPVRVEGWGPAWAATKALATTVRRHRNPMFLGPFDNLIWHRPRVQRLFGFTQIFEAYKPSARRQHGYYVCPLLADGRLIGRADLARQHGALVVHRASFERDAGPDAPVQLVQAGHALAAATGQFGLQLPGITPAASRGHPSPFSTQVQAGEDAAGTAGASPS
ncbi:crosslink repair DNA glycosylase YcaQ family protein [Streptomyces sp. NPDC051577]|uniref:DNA glycosylase AlkZ-like family protein n=1 Tax=Streptomyces sp. NPDC051577 TaxID=3155166 RepID=UPI0034365A33